MQWRQEDQEFRNRLDTGQLEMRKKSVVIEMLGRNGLASTGLCSLLGEKEEEKRKEKAEKWRLLKPAASHTLLPKVSPCHLVVFHSF